MAFPFIEVHDLHLGPVPFHPFGILVASGVLIGSVWAVRRAIKSGLDRAKMESLITYVLVFGFVLSHVLDVVMYRPRTILTNPIDLVLLNHGISSFGGFIGAIVGGLVWRLVKKERILAYGDQMAAVFPVGWLFGRAGCSTAHDHIGRLTDNALLGVRFPIDSPFPPGLRYDLGLLEFFATIPIAAITLWYARKPRPAGTICGLIALLYAPVRFFLDGLRGTDFAGADARYVGLTPGQWGSVGFLAIGVLLFVQARGKPASPIGPPGSSHPSALAS